MAPKTHGEKLFGAACLRVTLEQSQLDPSTNEIYQGALRDLGLTAEEVEAYLRVHRELISAALAARRAPKQ